MSDAKTENYTYRCGKCRQLVPVDEQCSCSLAEPQGSAADGSVTLTKDEYRVMRDLAWMVLNSKQNVGLRIKDQAASARKILESKRPTVRSGDWVAALSEIKDTICAARNVYYAKTGQDPRGYHRAMTGIAEAQMQAESAATVELTHSGKKTP